MCRSFLFALVAVAACGLDSEPEVGVATAELAATVTRDHVAGDVYHYTYVVPVGSGPNARLRIHRVVRERALWLPRRTDHAVMLMHGDFASFTTSFMPGGTGMAAWLAARDIDVWGLDRRWTQAGAGDVDVSDFGGMGVVQELDDIGTALAFARVTRAVTTGALDQMILSGFSRGGELAYFYASREATRPAWQRHIKGLVPLDVYVSLSPADEDLRQFFCDTAAGEYGALDAGFTDGPNDFQITVGTLARDAPDDLTPIEFLAGLTNREVMFLLVGQTNVFFLASPNYHLSAPVLDGGVVTGLRESSEVVIDNWLASAPPHQSMREQADTDALTCGDAPLPADVPLSRIHVPLFLLAAAGGYGDHALFSTTQVSSTDVTTHVIRQLPPEREAEDFGHADILFSPNAPALAWQPLLSWLRAH